MAQRISTLPGTNERGDAWLVAVSAFLLAGLAIADRTVAWMLGEFPTSAALWELRFEYLRPIGVFHDIAVQNLGDVSVGSFNVTAALAGLLVAFGAMSGNRLARAVSSHLLLVAALVVAAYSIDPGEGVYATVGVPSKGYLLIGLLLTASAAVMCVSSHCEYVGWNPATSPIVRRAKMELQRSGSAMREQAAKVLGQTYPASGEEQAILVRARRGTVTSTMR